MRLNHVLFGFACLVAPLAACGDDGGGSSLTAGSYLTQFTDIFCGSAFECESSFPETPQTGTHEDNFGPDEATCKTGFITAEQIQASVDAGRVTFDAGVARTCLSKFEALDCAGYWDALTVTGLPAECDVALVGTVATGGQCTLNVDCVSVSCSTSGTCNAPQ